MPDLEEAMTLQVYAEGEFRIGHHETGQELLERSRSLYSKLGLGITRAEWADVFTAGSERSATPSSND